MKGFWQRVYSLLAQQIIDDYQIKKGRCVDIGCGDGKLGLELAKKTALYVYMLDINKDVLLKAKDNCCKTALSNQTTIIQANVEQLPFLSNLFDLVVSRGSIFFWNDKVAGLREIYRVLKPCGVAMIGGGTSRYMSNAQKQEFIRSVTPVNEEKREECSFLRSPDYFRQILHQAGICNFNLISAPPGVWTEIIKS